jgi:hypothetical protein
VTHANVAAAAVAEAAAAEAAAAAVKLRRSSSGGGSGDHCCLFSPFILSFYSLSFSCCFSQSNTIYPAGYKNNDIS